MFSSCPFFGHLFLRSPSMMLSLRVAGAGRTIWWVGMRPVVTAGLRNQELLWWEFFVDHLQRWSNRCIKKTWEYLAVAATSTKEGLRVSRSQGDLVTSSQLKAHMISIASAQHLLDVGGIQESNVAKSERVAGNGHPFVSVEDLRNLCQKERLDVAIQALGLMHQGGSYIYRDMVYDLLQGCTKTKDLVAGRQVYSLMISIGLDSIAYLGDHLIRLFAMCGRLLEANEVFRKISKPTSYTWNAIISAHAELGDSETAMELYCKMQDRGFQPDTVTFLGALKACGIVGTIQSGRLVHEQIIRSGLESGVVIGSTLVDMYAKCGSLEEGHKVFDTLPYRNAVSWNAMIAGYTQHGNSCLAFELFEEMQKEDLNPNKVTFSCMLKACASTRAIEKGRSIHYQLIGSGLELDAIIGSILVDMYAKCGSLEDGRTVFDKLPFRNVVSWNVMIAGYAQHKKGILALDLFEKMQHEGTKPDKVTFSNVAKVCGSLGALEQGRLVHEQLSKSALDADVIIGNTLIDMYAKCGSLEKAFKVFDRMPSRNVVSWSAMITGYAQCGDGYLALELFEKMQQEGINPHKVLYSCILKVCGNLCGNLAEIGQGRQIHEQVLKCGFDTDLVVGNTLIDMYAKCGSLEEGHCVFNELPGQDVVSWNAIITGYAQHDVIVFNALELFQKMQSEGVQPNEVTYSCILNACCRVGALGQGRLIHNEVIRIGLDVDVVLGSTLLDMYAKCGSLEEAYKMFRGLPRQNAVSWNSLIAGYAQHGNYTLARQCFEDMQREGRKPDDRTYTSILSACSHTGQVEEGYQYFKSMKEEHGIVPSLEHINCMVGLLGCVGCTNEAEKLLQTTPSFANISSWSSLLTSCTRYGNLELGRQCLNQAVHLVPDSATGYTLMSNICADHEMWDDVQKIQEMRKCAGAWKKPGKAWVESNNMVHEFIVGDKTHQDSNNIYAKLSRLRKTMKEGGYVPHVILSN